MEVACNLAPFGVSSNNNLIPILESETAALESESSDFDNNEEMPILKQCQTVVPDNCNSAKLVPNGTNDETNGNNIEQTHNNGNLAKKTTTENNRKNNKYNNNIINNNINNFVQNKEQHQEEENKEQQDKNNKEQPENSNDYERRKNQQSDLIEKSTLTNIANGTLVNGNSLVPKKVDSNNKNRVVKFLVDETGNDGGNNDFEKMNHNNLTSSQPLVLNGHVIGNLTCSDLTENQKLANSHPHVTISSEHVRGEDRTFGTKIDNSYQGWDNPFRPEGELSHDAEEILRLWKEGRRDFSLLLNEAKEDEDEDEDEADDENKNEMNNANNDFKEPLLNSTQQNGKASKNNKSIVDVKTTSVTPPPLKSEMVSVVMGSDEPKKKQGCCSLM